MMDELENPELTGLQKIHKADKIMKVCAVAWTRSGSGGPFSECFMHWETLKASYRDIYSVIQEDVIPKYSDPRKKRELVNQLNNLAERDFLPYAFTIIDSSFRREDVSPAFVTVLQNQNMQGSAPMFAINSQDNEDKATINVAKKDER